MGVVLKEVWGTPSYNRRNRIYFCPYLMIIQRGGGGGAIRHDHVLITVNIFSIKRK